MIRFRLFNVPVNIQPWHWLGLAFLGGAFYLNNVNGVIFVLLFMIAGFFNILAHEMGHALVGRHYGGGDAEVTLILLGGYTVHYSNRYRTLFGRRAMLGAGIAINLLTALLCCAITVYLLRNNPGVIGNTLLDLAKYPNLGAYTLEKHVSGTDGIIKLQLPYFFLASVMWTSFWWGLFNLLPIFPMDGGQLLDTFVRNHKTTHQVGFFLAIVLMAVGFMMGFYILGIFMLFFAYDNYERMQKSRF